MSRRLSSASAAATHALGTRLGAAARAGDIFLIEGGLGAGKTVLVQGMAAGLEAPDVPTSPTFVLVHHHRGRLELVHADLYRLQDRDQIDALDLLGLAEAGVLAVEWGDRAPWLAAGEAARLVIAPAAGQAREVTLISGPAHVVAAFGGEPG